MNPVDQRRKQVAAELEVLNRQVDEMDGKIRAYLADRQNKPHPRHLELIEKIQGYRIDPAISTKHLVTILDNLQWKVYYNKRAWKQFWDNAEDQRRKENPNTAVFSETAGPPAGESMVHGKTQYSVDTLWEIQKEKLRAYGHDEVQETKTEFKKRMVQEYRELSRNKKSNQEIIMIFDKDSHHCKLGLK